MNEQNPELFKIMGAPPKGLIISGCLWFFLCISIISGMYFIKYSQHVNVSIIYLGNNNSLQKDRLLFSIIESNFELLADKKGSKIKIYFNSIGSIQGNIVDVFTTDGIKTFVFESFKMDKVELSPGCEGKARVPISKKRLIELIPFFKN